jgi:hypothetical protein
MLVIQGRLEGSSASEYASHRILAIFSEQLTIGQTPEPIWKISEHRVDVTDGVFALALPDLDKLKNSLLLKVVAADGEVLITREFLLDEVESGIKIQVTAKPFFELGQSDDPYLGKKSKLTGRVLDLDGKRQISNKQVILLARKADAAEDLTVVLATQTDRQGYFSAEYPREEYIEAYGLVLIGTNEHIPIQLQAGQFPKNVILAIKAPEEAPDEHDCACEEEVPRTPDSDELSNGTYSTDLGGGKCVNFTVPNRTLEEFSFYTIVRTTEPEIKGLTIAEPRRISAQLLASIAGLPVLSQSNQIAGSIPADATTVARTLQSIDPLVLSALASAQPNPNDMAANDLVNAARTMVVGNLTDTAINSAVRLAQTIPLNPDLLKAFVSDPDSFTIPNLMTAERFTAFGDLTDILNTLKKNVPSRSNLSASNSVDWDDEPTFYQATTVAHGHILHFKQVWKADGYSMGDLLYSLPLAPCQKKQIVTIDWDRREVGARTEQLESEEQLNAVLTRDRDVGEIVNSTLSESLRGGSEASTWAAGGGLGLAIGPLVLGAAGGGGGASSTAWQNSSRNLAANSLQQLRDRTMQSASAVRSQRSTVVQTVRQGESMRVQTEVVTNHNHCHAITMQYFEVLRHFAIDQQLADVQECLFVPLLISKFDNAKALRWRESLGRYLRNNSMRGAFNAIERIRNNYVGSDLPTGRYAQETLEYLDGELRISFQLARPRDKADETFEETAWALYSPFLWAAPAAIFNQYFVGVIQAERDRIFQQQVAPRIAEAFVQSLKFYLIGTSGRFEVTLDSTLVSDYAPNTPLYVSLRLAGNVPAVAREWITRVEIRSDYALPPYSKAIVWNGSIRYRTKYMSHFLFRDWRINNDLLPGDPVQIPTFLDRQELRNPREEDRELAKRLISHLNENLEYYHRSIWWSMDSERRYMLLDGFIAPNANGRSVASVVENRLIGIIGNSLIMPVARGFKLDPTYRQDLENPIDLLEHYAPNTPIPPMRVSVPTRGVYGESVMGACNSCEVKDDTRFWRFEESPCGDEPTPIQSPGTDSRRADPGNLQPKDLPTPIINIQNSPAAPDPTGLAAVLQILGTPGIFKDITGLEGNQRNALAAFQSALSASQSFGGEAAQAVREAAKLEQQKTMQQNSDRTFQAIRQAQSSGLINKDQANSLTQEALRNMISGSTQPSSQPVTTADVEQLTNTAGANDANVRVTRPTGEQVEVNARSAVEDSTASTIIILSPTSGSADARAFFPSRSNKSGIIEPEVMVRNAPVGSTYHWTTPDPASISINSPTSTRTIIRGLRPGKTTVDFAVRDAGGTQLSSIRLQLCIPQFVTINEDAAAFNAILTAIHLDSLKDDVLKVAKSVCDHLLQTSNVRTIWQLAPFSETLPPHLPPANVTALTLRGDPPAGEEGTLGQTNSVGGTGGAAVFNETIDIFPGAYDDPVPPGTIYDGDVETQALIIQLQSMTFTNPALEQFAIQVYGRLMGETMAHEIVHSLLWTEIDRSFHNNPPIPNDLMNNGANRNFQQRTGFKDTTFTSPVDPANFVDGGIAAIGGLQATNQGLMDARFPVPPKFT